jgi:hypothetical protein
MPKKADLVDQFIEQMSAEQQEIAHTLRGVIRNAAKSLQESIKWGYPCYVGVGNICSILPYRDHVNLAFYRGEELDDPDELLEGTGKGMRHVKISSPKDIRSQAKADLIRSAVSLDQESGV